MSQDSKKQYAGAGGLSYAPGPSKIDLPIPIKDDTSEWVRNDIEEDPRTEGLPYDASTDQIGNAIMPSADWAPMQGSDSVPAPAAPPTVREQIEMLNEREAQLVANVEARTAPGVGVYDVTYRDQMNEQIERIRAARKALQDKL